MIAAGVESMTRVPMGLSSQLPAKNGFGRRFSLEHYANMLVRTQNVTGEEIELLVGRDQRDVNVGIEVDELAEPGGQPMHADAGSR